MQKHIQHYSTGCLCNVTNCYEICLCIDQFRELLFKLHGSIMCVVFVFLLPTAALVARHYRQVFPEKWFEVSPSMVPHLLTTPTVSRDIDGGGCTGDDTRLRIHLGPHGRNIHTCMTH
jgi:hypothetical protein